MMDLHTGLHTALSNYIERCTWNLSTAATNLHAFKERTVLKVEFNNADMFGIGENNYRHQDGIPDWKKDLLQTEAGYRTALDILLDSHNMFIKLNNKVPHRLDIMIPSLQFMPLFTKTDAVDVSRWSKGRSQKVSNENRLIATQACDAGDGMRRLHWTPSLDLLTSEPTLS